MIVLVHSALMYVLFLKEQLSKMQIMWYLILPVQAILTSLLLIDRHIIQMVPISIIEAFQHNFFSTGPKLILLGSVFGIFVGLLTGFIVFLRLKRKFGEIQPYQRVLERIIVISCCLIYVIELIMPFILLELKDEFILRQEKDQTISTIMLIIVLPFNVFAVLFVTVMNRNVRLFGYFWVLIPIFMHYSFFFSDDSLVKSSSIISFLKSVEVISPVLLIAVIIHQIYCDEGHEFLIIKGKNIRNILHIQILLYSLVELCWSLSSEDSLLHIDLISMAIMCLLLTMILIFSTFKGRSKLNLIKLCKIARKKMKGIETDEDEIEIKNLIAQEIRSMDNNNEINIVIENLKRKQFEEWERGEWALLIDELANYSFAQDPSLTTIISLLNMKLIMGSPVTNIISLYNLLVDRFAAGGIFNMYAIIDITLKITRHQFAKHEEEDTLFVHTLLEINNLETIFYERVQYILTRYSEFWENVKKKRCEQFAQNLMNIQSEKARIQGILKQMQKYSSFRKESALVQFINQLVFHQNEGILGSEASQDSISKRIKNLEFFSCQDELISKISLQFAKELRYSVHELEGQHIRKIIPTFFYLEIKKIMASLESKTVEIPFLVPFQSQSGCFIVKEVECYLQFDIHFGHNFTFYTKECLENKFPMLLFDVKKNLIRGYNRQFIKQMIVDEDSFAAAVRKETVNSEEILSEIELYDPQIQSQLINHQSKLYNCSLELTRFRKNNHIFSASNMRISLIKNYNSDYFLLRISRSNEVDLLTEIIQRDITANIATHNFIPDRKPEEVIEGLSCPIQNPYKFKIINKKAELMKGRTLNLPCLIIFVIWLALGTLMAEAILFAFVNEDRSEESFKHYQIQNHSFTAMKSLFDCYNLHYQSEIIKHHIDDFISYDIEPTRLIQDFQAEIRENIYMFTFNALKKNSQLSPTQLSQSLEDKNSNKMVLVDYAENFLSKDSAVSKTFLMNNYLKLRNIWKDQFAKIKENYFQFFSSSSYLIQVTRYLSVFVAASLFVISIICLIAMQRIIEAITAILLLIDIEGIDHNHMKLKKFKSIFELVADKDDDVGTQNLIIDERKSVAPQAEEDQILLEGIEGLSPPPKAQTKSESKTALDSSRSFPQKYLIHFYALFTMIIVVELTFQDFEFERMNTELQEVMEYTNKDTELSTRYVQKLTDLFHEFITEIQLGSPEVIAHQTELKLMNFESLPGAFHYSQQYLEFMSSNLCAFNYPVRESGLSKQVCGEVLLGTLELGLKQSSTEFQTSLNFLTDNGYQHLLFQSNSTGKPFLMEIIFYKDITNYALKKQKQAFDQRYAAYRQQNHNDLIQSCIIELALELLCVALLIIIKRQLNARSRVTIGYFMIISNKILLGNSIMKYLRQNRILDRISCL